MSVPARLLGLALVALSLSASGDAAGGARRPVTQTTLTVFAAASLAEAFEELGAVLEKSRPGLTVRFNFAGSQQLAAQIEQGAVADLFAPADWRSMKRLGDRHLLGGNPRVFARNELVVIVPRSNPARIGSLLELARRHVKIVLGSPATPVGAYSREVLRRMSLNPEFVSNFGQRVMANVVSEEENVKAVVAKVVLGEADAGIVYRSDVTEETNEHVRVFPLPPSVQVVAEYPIALVRGAPTIEAAHAFLKLLGSRTGRAVLERHHLDPVAPDTGRKANPR